MKTTETGLDLLALNEDLEKFEDLFRQTLENTAVGQGGWRSLFCQVRDSVLPRYPNLDVCYHQHGLQHDLPAELQGNQARFGRRVAGVMWTALEQVRKDRESPAGQGTARYISASIEDIPAQPEPRLRQKATIELAKQMREVQPGQRLVLAYDNPDDLKRDQVLLKNACLHAGWFDGLREGYIPWKSRSKTEAGKHILTIDRPLKPFKRRSNQLKTP